MQDRQPERKTERVDGSGTGSGSAEPAGKVCPACGNEYAADLRFCPRDGMVLQPKERGSDLVGHIIGERYHVLAKLGHGGMGEVYLAEHVKIGRKAAIKVLHPALRGDTDAISRFGREAANAGRINHPHVADIYDFEETRDGLIYLAMEYVPGEPLSHMLGREGAFPVERTIRIGIQIADALSAAHAIGVVHRDLKPDNIIVGRTREGHDFAKVVDFGIAKAAQSSTQNLTRTGFVIGTLRYMSPEQLVGDPVDGRSDLYALGSILYELLVGERAFDGPSGEVVISRRLTEPPPQPRGRNPGVPQELDEIVVRLLARSPADRFGTAEELRETLRALLPPTTAYPQVLTPPQPVATSQRQTERAAAETVPPLAAGLPKSETSGAAPPPAVDPAEAAERAADGSGWFSPEQSPTPAAETGGDAPPADPVDSHGRELGESSYESILSPGEAVEPPAPPPPSAPTPAGDAHGALATPRERIVRRRSGHFAIGAAVAALLAGGALLYARSVSEPAGPAELSILGDIPPSARIEVNQSVISGRTISLPAGSHRIRIAAAGFLPLDTVVVLRAGEQLAWSAALQPESASRTGTAELSITAELPADARIEVNDQVAAAAHPLRLPPGSHRIRITAPGFLPVDTLLSVRGGEQLSWAPALEREEGLESAELRVTGNFPAGVRILVNETAVTSRVIPLAPGRHRIRVEARGFVPVDSFFTVRSGERLSWAPALRPATPSTVELRIVGDLPAGARIQVGESPISGRSVTLPPGSYRVRVQASGYTSADTVLNLRAGAQVSWSPRLRPEPEPPELSRQRINAVITRYAQALSTRDIDQVRSVYPAMTATERATWETLFSDASVSGFRIEVVEVGQPRLEGDAAQLTFKLDMSYRSSGYLRETSLTYHATLAREGGTWRLESLRH
jgi:serine/threonine protein kinase